MVVLSGCGAGEQNVETVAERTAASKEVATSEAPPPVECPAPSKQLRVTLDGYMGAENIGILMAKQRGYFRDLGLKVWVGSPASPEAPVSYVGAGVDDVGVTEQPQAVVGREVGEPIIAIGTLMSKPTAAMIWLRGSGIGGLADLKGKTVAVPSFSPQEELLRAALAEARLSPRDVKIRPVGYKLVAKLLAGKVDAILGASANMEGAALESKGAEPVVTPVGKLGIPSYEQLVVIARSKCLAKYPAMYRHFMAAVAQGTAAAQEDPQAATQVIEQSIEGNPEANRGQTEAQVAATLPLLSRSGHMDLAEATELISWMHAQGVIDKKPPAAQLFTNNYLAP